MNPIHSFPVGGQIQSYGYGTCRSGAANVYRLTETDGLVPIPEAVFDGYLVRMKVDVANTGAVTLQVGMLPPAAVRTVAGKALAGGEWKAGQIVEVCYDAVNQWWQFESGSAAPTQARAWVKFNGANLEVSINNAVDTTNDVLTTGSAHGIAAGTTTANVPRVSIRASTTMPVGTVTGTRYYARIISTTTLSLHTTAQGALDNTSRVDITGNGSGAQLQYIPILDSYGVDCVIRAGTAAGQYIVFFTTSFATADFAVVGSAKSSDEATYIPVVHVAQGDTGLTDRKRIRVQAAGAGYDSTEVCLLAFGNI